MAKMNWSRCRKQMFLTGMTSPQKTNRDVREEQKIEVVKNP